MELEQVVDTVDVPRNTGTAGFLELLKSILHLGHVLEIHITGNGKVTYKYLRPRGEESKPFNPEQLFDQVSPAYVLRNSVMQELRTGNNYNSVEMLFRMFRAARLDSVYPIAWVVGASTLLPTWLIQRSEMTEETTYPNDVLLGLPVFSDRLLPDESLTLCAGPQRGVELVETTHSYKIAMVLP